MATPPVAARSPAWMRILLGCAVAFGVVLLVAFGLFAYGFYWFFSPGRQMPAAAVVGPDSVGAIRVDDASRDPGMQALLGKFLAEMQRMQSRSSPLPSGLEWIREWRSAQARGGVEAWLPREAMVSLEPAPGEEEAHLVAALNMRRLVRPIGFGLRWAMGHDPSVTSTSYKGYPLLVPPKGPVFCFADGTIVMGSRREAVTGALDRLDRPMRPGPSLADQLQGFAGHWDVYGTLARGREAQGFMTALVETAQGPEGDDKANAPLLAVEGVTFALDVRTEDETRYFLRARFPSGPAAGAALPAFQGLVDQAAGRARSRGLELQATIGAEGPEVVVQGGLSGISAAIERWFEDMARQAGRSRSEPRPAPASR
jgi:hypothetical protein